MIIIVSVWTRLSLASLSSDKTLSLSVDGGSLTVTSEGFISSERELPFHEIRLFGNRRCQVQRRLRGPQVHMYIEIATVNGTILVGESVLETDYSGA